MSDKDIKNWDQRLNDQAKSGWDNYLRRRIYLDVARDNQEMLIAGEYLYVEEVSSTNVVASMRINRNTNDEIDLGLGVTIETVFIKIYITNTAQPGEWIDVVVGINFKYYQRGTATGGGGGGYQYREDAVHVSGDYGNGALVVRKDTPAQLAGADGDYSLMVNDDNGRLHTHDTDRVISRNIAGETTIINAASVTTGTSSSDVDLETNGYEGAHVTVDADFPGSPTDNLVVEVLASLDGVNYDDTPLYIFEIDNGTDPNQVSFIIKDVMHFKLYVYRSGVTDTITVTAKYQAWNYQSIGA